MFLEVFAGEAVLTKVLRLRGFGAVAVDIRHGHDILEKKTYNKLKGWVDCGLVWGVWFGTPCSSFTRARRAPQDSSLPHKLRDAAWPQGLPNLGQEDEMKVTLGNKVAKAAGDLAARARKRGLVVGEENPWLSWLWALPSRLAQEKTGVDIVFDQCAFGTPWRGRSRVRLWHVSPLEVKEVMQKGMHQVSFEDRYEKGVHKVSSKGRSVKGVDQALIGGNVAGGRVNPLMCSARGVCRFTGRPHLELSGRSEGGFRTAAKARYPRRLAVKLAKLLSDTALRRAAAARWSRNGVTSTVAVDGKELEKMLVTGQFLCSSSLPRLSAAPSRREGPAPPLGSEGCSANQACDKQAYVVIGRSLKFATDLRSPCAVPP